LKAALLLADVEPQVASVKAQEAIAAGVFASNADNALLKYDGATTGNSNNVWYTLVFSGRKDYAPAGFFVTTLKDWNDPRLSLYFAKNAANDYSGGTAGIANDYATLSPLSNVWLAATRPADLLDYAETEFLLAEAAERGVTGAGNAEAHYKAGIKASITAWGGNETDAETYVNNETAIQYSTAQWKKRLGYQLWFAFADRGWDAWTVIRRLGYPDIDVDSPPTSATGQLPQRLSYPSVEQTSNARNWAEAVAKIAGKRDVAGAKLFWETSHE
jgi:hypothetical protein